MYDFSQVQVALATSLPARSHAGWTAVQNTGHPGLMGAVNELGLACPSGRSLALEYIVSMFIPLLDND